MKKDVTKEGSSYRMQGIIAHQLISMHKDVQRITNAIIGQEITPEQALSQLEAMADFLHIAIGAAHAEREKMRSD